MFARLPLPWSSLAEVEAHGEGRCLAEELAAARSNGERVGERVGERIGERVGERACECEAADDDQ